MNEKNPFRSWHLIIFLLITLLAHLPVSALFFHDVLTRPARVFIYLFSGAHLGIRWLMAGAAGLLVTAISYGHSHPLTGGVQRINNGPYGDAHFADPAERRRMYLRVLYRNARKPGFTLSYNKHDCEVDTSDRTVLLVSPPGGGKTKSVLLPTLLYNGIVNKNTNGGGASILSIDCKGEEYQTTAAFMQQHGYRTLLLDFRDPLSGMQYNMLHTINQYMDTALHTTDPTIRLEARANAERHAKILSDAISVATDLGGHGDKNPFFVETAKGLITAIILVVSEFGAPGERHIVSVFRLIVELNGLLQSNQRPDDGQLQRSRLGALLNMLPGDVRAKLYAGAATSADVRTSMNVFSSALSKLLAFLDAQLEQMVCFQSDGLTADEFIRQPTCIYLVLPDEDNTAHFFATLFIQQMSTVLVHQASSLAGQRLPRQVLVLWDEFGQAPPCKGMESWITTWRSRGIRLLLALQNEAQLEDRYGRSRAEVIREAIQIRMYSNLGSGETAQKLSKELGNYTVVTQSVTNNNQNGSTSQSMTARPLLSHDEIGALPLGTWLVLTNGHNPIKTKLCCYDRVWPKIQPTVYSGNRRPIKPIPYLTEQKLYERYADRQPDPLTGALDHPMCSIDPKPPKAPLFHNQR